jgi:hypothetical protein
MEEGPVLKAPCRLVNRPGVGSNMVLPAWLLMYFEIINIKPISVIYMHFLGQNIFQK